MWTAVTTVRNQRGRTATAASQRRAQLPQQREEAQVAAPTRVGAPGRTARALLVADLPLHDGRVQRPPLRGQLVVRQQAFGDVPQVAVRRPVPGYGEQRRLHVVVGADG